MTETILNRDCIRACNELLRGEISAVETYGTAIDKFKDEPEVATLIQIRDGHRASVQTLTENVRSMGGQPDHDSGAWGTFANAVQSASALFGENAALTSLINGEEHGIHEYESALNSDDVMTECKAMIRSELLPRLLENKATLEQLRDRV
ncbi:DUF2383 domain-containing protein [Roseibacillus ishigakijimensis]|uniref:DUF2383 domain-containing protein n=1 Tax=Roseibacillus ishigakijimensis TaxID=454146 RepID=A0A934RQ19_9BACT|nr:DUF2383 domain-containing protein [Roseibacillus ishigakijimensis]MBK1832431.1 DUF2383 domain-containing protein [Roseibacillus ishigakijimensis]